MNLSSRKRPRLNLFGISFGLAGLAGTWTAAAAAGLAPAAIGDLLWAVATLTWLTLLVRCLWRADPSTLAADLRNPVLGAFAELVPVTGLRVGGRLAMEDAGVARTVGVVVITTTAAATVLFGIWFFGWLVLGQLDWDVLHPGHLLPTTAAPLLAAQSSVTASWDRAAVAFFTVRLLSWLLVGTVLLARW